MFTTVYFEIRLILNEFKHSVIQYNRWLRVYKYERPHQANGGLPPLMTV